MRLATRVSVLASLLGMFACLLTAAVSHAQANPKTDLSKDEILNRWAAALGGREHLAHVTSYHIHSRLSAGGLTGTYDEQGDAQGQRRESVDLGEAFKQDNVISGGQGWVRDGSGKVHQVSGEELQDVVTSAYEESFSYLLPGRMPGRVEVAGEDAAGKSYVVKLFPEGGKAVTIYLDKSTFLPLREERPAASVTQTTSFSDWRDAGGVMMPGKSSQSNGDPKFDGSLTLEKVDWNPVFDAQVFSKPGETALPVKFASGKHEAVFPFEPSGNHILVPVRVNGSQPAWFFFDSGADLSVIDAAWSKKLGLVSKGAMGISGSGEGSAQLGMLNDVFLGLPGVDVPIKTAAAVPLSPMFAFFGREIDGIVGYDVISRFVVEIDYAGHMIHLHDPATYHYSGSGTAVPFTFLENKPLVHAKVAIEGQPPLEGEFTIDTGAGMFVSFTSPFVDSHHLLAAGYKTIDAPSAGIGGISRDVAGRLVSLQIGPYSMSNPIAAFSRDTKGSGANRNQSGNIGGELLRRFTVVFDYSHQMMYLEPNSQFNDPFDAGMSGLSLVSPPPDFSSFRVAFIIPDSPAAVAGLKVGDVVTAIDGQPVKEISLAGTAKMFRQDGRTYRLTVQRDGNTMEVPVKMRRMI